MSISRNPYVLLRFRKSYFTKRHFLSIRKHRGIEFQSHTIKSSRWQFSGFGKSSEQITYGNGSLRAPRVSAHCRFCAEVADHELRARDSVPISFADRAQRKTQRKACSMGQAEYTYVSPHVRIVTFVIEVSHQRTIFFYHCFICLFSLFKKHKCLFKKVHNIFMNELRPQTNQCPKIL